MPVKKTARMLFDLVFRFNGQEYRVADASTNFAINKIPTGSVSLAIGRDARTLDRALIHDTADQFREVLPAEIVFRPTGEWSPEDAGFDSGKGRWDSVDEQVIFNGFVAGSGYRKQRGAVRFNVSLVHWLSNLNFSSALSNQSHPGNPVRFRWRAVYGSQGASTTAKTNFIADYVSDDLFTTTNIAEDFWAKSLHPFFCQLSEQDILSELGEDACVGLDGSNTASQEALRRFEKQKGDDDVVGEACDDGASSPYWKPLRFQLGFVEQIISKSISRYCRRQAMESYFSSTLWDKLVGELSPAFYFSIVPRVHTAMAVPFVPGLRQTFDQEYGNGKVLDIRDITYLDTNGLSQRPLKAVGVLQPYGASRTGMYDRTPLQQLGGCYVGGEAGMVIYKQPPPWLSSAPGHAHRMQRTAMPASPGSTTTPAEPGSSVGDDTGETPASTLNQLKDYYGNVAQAAYAYEMLRGRFAIVQGKLRFDLAPGTNVAIRNASPLFLDNDQLSQDGVASIVRVGIAMSAESQTAGTSFQLEHLRTAAENERPQTSVERHPLYQDVYTGAPLLHDYLFSE